MYYKFSLLGFIYGLISIDWYSITSIKLDPEINIPSVNIEDDMAYNKVNTPKHIQIINIENNTDFNKYLYGAGDFVVLFTSRHCSACSVLLESVKQITERDLGVANHIPILIIDLHDNVELLVKFFITAVPYVMIRHNGNWYTSTERTASCIRHIFRSNFTESVKPIYRYSLFAPDRWLPGFMSIVVSSIASKIPINHLTILCLIFLIIFLLGMTLYIELYAPNVNPEKYTMEKERRIDRRLCRYRNKLRVKKRKNQDESTNQKD